MFQKNNKHEDYFFHFAMTLRQRSGFLFLVVIIIVAELFIQFYSLNRALEPQLFTPKEKEIIAKGAINNANYKEQEESAIVLFPFNPNTLDKAGFMRLGFSEKQASSIIKYRYIKGGNFSTIEEFGESYVISDKKLETLRPYIELKQIRQPESNKGFQKSEDKFIVLEPFNINSKGKNGFIELGFSEKQAQTIINFKNSLPQKQFKSKEQFRKCYAVNDYMFNKLKPFILINKAKDEKEKEVSQLNYKINTINAAQFVDLGFSEQEASNIVKYRDFIGGFIDLEAFKDCGYVRTDIYENIKEQVIIE